MNPFDLRGPEFLVFYAVFTAVLCVALHWLRRTSEMGQPGEGRVPLNDPYQIAYLRGGKNEAIRVAAISLIERGLLERCEKNDLITKGRAVPQVNDPLEQELLRFFHKRQAAPEAFKMIHGHWERVLEPRHSALERAGLLPDASRREFRFWLAIFGALILLSLGAVKVSVGMSRGKPVLFLVFFTAIAVGILIAVLYSYRRTRRGDAALADIRGIFAGLKIAPSGTADLVMLGAVFGMAAMPLNALPYLPDLYPQARKDGNSSGCGSSCGSSCGGGGGCGGGGCGGCGS